jgi:hypothetical protein
MIKMFHQLLSISYIHTFWVEDFQCSICNTVSVKRQCFFFGEGDRFLEISETNPSNATMYKCYLQVHTIKSVVTNTDGN